jgi:hypothetical protein
MQNPRAHFVVNLGNDTFDVITGYKLNRDPLNLADANKIARRSTASVSSVAGSLVVSGTTKP